jgi:hypothetical protein
MNSNSNQISNYFGRTYNYIYHDTFYIEIIIMQCTLHTLDLQFEIQIQIVWIRR